MVVVAMDEESKFSMVVYGKKDMGEDDEDDHIDAHNDETFGDILAPPIASTNDTHYNILGTCKCISFLCQYILFLLQ
jgi:hypothetical protein